MGGNNSTESGRKGPQKTNARNDDGHNVQPEGEGGNVSSKKVYAAPKVQPTNGSSKLAQKNKGKDKPGKSNKKDSTNQELCMFENNYQEELSSLLPPSPASTTKHSFVDGVDFSEVDQHAVNAPRELLMGSYNDLVEYLTDDDWDDLAKTRAIFRWITSYDVIKMKIDVTPPPNSPLEYFSKIQCELGSYANLFYILCEIAEVPCVVVDGINKGLTYKVGEPIDRQALKSQWNAVFVCDEWRLVDTFWGNMCAQNEMPDQWRYHGTENANKSENDSIYSNDSDNSDIVVNADQTVNGDVREVTRQTTVLEGTNNLPTDEEISEAGKDKNVTNLSWKKHHKIIANEQYFLTIPSEMISSHYPDDNLWQLLEDTVTFQEFQEQAFIRDRFHQLDMRIAANIYDKCVIEAVGGETELVLSLPPERSKNYGFKYILSRTHLAEEERTQLDMYLDRFIIFEHLEDTLRFSFQFPISGRFKLDIFGLDSATSEINRYALVCSYILVSKQAQTCIPLPDNPTIGWGPGIASTSMEIEPLSHKVSTIQTEDGRLEIIIGGTEEHQLKMRLRNPFSDEANLYKYAIIRWTGNEYVVNTRLPKTGLYSMSIYSKNIKTSTDEYCNVLNYLIRCYGTNLKHDPFPNITIGNIGANPACRDLRVRCKGNGGGMIKAEDGFAHVEFESDGNFELSCELHTNVSSCADRMRVTQRCTKNKTWFHLDLPGEGEYAMNVFAHKKRNDFSFLHNLHAFIVQSTGRTVQEGTVGRAKNNNFWKDTRMIVAETIYTKTPDVSVPIPADHENVVAFLECRGNDEAPSKENVKTVMEQGVMLFLVNLPRPGEYTLCIYEKSDKVFLKSIGRYYILWSNSADVVEDELVTIMETIRAERQRAGQDVSAVDATSEVIRARKEKELLVPVDEAIARAQRLYLSLESRDPAIIKKALVEMQTTNLEQGALVRKAKQIIKYQEAKIELNRAYKARSLPELEKAIVKAHAVNTDKSLDMPLLLGRRIRDRLRVLQRLSEDVRQADHKILAELQTYDNPPAGIHSSVKAALLLLGYPLSESKKWTDCKAIMHQSGNNNVAQIMANFDPKNVPIATALEAKQIVEPYTDEKMREISPGAAGVYTWVKSMVKELEASVGTLNEGNPHINPADVVEHRQKRQRKKDVSMINRHPPRNTEGSFKLEAPTYKNVYKQRKQRRLSFPRSYPGSSRNGSCTVSSNAVGSKSLVSANSSENTQSTADGHLTVIVKRNGKTMVQADLDEKWKTSSKEPDSHGITGVHSTQDSQSDGYGEYRMHMDEQTSMSQTENRQMKKNTKKPLKASESEFRITDQFTDGPKKMVDRNSYEKTPQLETGSEMSMKADSIFVNLNGAPGYRSQFKIKKAHQKAPKVGSLPHS